MRAESSHSKSSGAPSAPEPLDRFVRERLRIGADQAYLDAIQRLYEYPARRRALSEQDRALVLLATEVLVTQLDPEGIERGIAAALASGATYDEIASTMQLASVIGLHSISYGVPRLRRVLEERGAWLGRSEDDPDLRAVIEAGYRDQPVAGMLRDIAELDPDYFVVFRDALEIPWQSGVLSEGLMQLICIAIHASRASLRRRT